jgi:hypothetical protein
MLSFLPPRLAFAASPVSVSPPSLHATPPVLSLTAPHVFSWLYSQFGKKRTRDCIELEILHGSMDQMVFLLWSLCVVMLMENQSIRQVAIDR